MGIQLSFPSLSLIMFLLTLLWFFKMEAIAAKESSKVYIVYMGEKQYEEPHLVSQLHHDMLASLLGSTEKALSSMFYSYKHGFSGFAATLTEYQARELAALPGVISVKPSRTYQLQTTRSWDFLGLGYDPPAGLVQKANYGDGIIIGVVDTGIWPESRSFSDHGYGPVPSRWKGKCVTEKSFGANNCSRKIIGARWYSGGIDPQDLKGEYFSPRDLNGHGTHTASTAGGVVLENISFHGLASSTARGGAPRARIAVYKACWGSRGSCSDAAVLKAMDDAIHDGVDILSLSVGGDGYPTGSLHAAAKGVTVVFASGNEGPAPQTVGNALPWVITVAASTIDRSFPTVLSLGNNKKLVGQGIFPETQDDEFKELVTTPSCDAESVNASDVAGKVVLCYPLLLVSTELLGSGIPDALSAVLQAGGAGVIYAQYTTNLLGTLALPGFLGFPIALVDFEIANKVVNYMDSTSKPVVKISLTRSVVGNEVLSPKVAAFSSRGPSPTFPELIQPDIAAPGVNILAAKRDSYQFDTGTSMACPHISGVAALLKSLHPDWSPAAIKSALVTTASVTDRYGAPIEAEGLPRKIADPFDYGGGLVDPNRASDPGLIYDIDPKDYLKFINCTSGDCGPVYQLNLPSVCIPNLKGVVTVWRTVTNVGAKDAVYMATVQPPPGVQMIVKPSVLVFNAATRTRSFKMTFKPTHRVQGDYTFGSLTLFDRKAHSVRIPIAVRTIIQDFYADTA